MADPVIQEVTVYEADIAALREMVGTTTMNDQRLAEVIALTANDDGVISLNLAAAYVWNNKASIYAELVNTSESGSKRDLSDLSKNALTMAKHYQSLHDKAVLDAAEAAAVPTRPSTRPIVRA